MWRQYTGFFQTRRFFQAVQQFFQFCCGFLKVGGVCGKGFKGFLRELLYLN